MRYKKKGFILLEFVLYISISLLIISIGIRILMDTREIYYKSLDRSINVNNIVEGFITIDNIAKDESLIKIETLERRIKFYYDTADGKIIKELIKDENKLIVRYYKKQGEVYSPYGSPNDIIANIEDFQVKNKGKLIYITIKKEGELYVKCI